MIFPNINNKQQKIIIKPTQQKSISKEKIIIDSFINHSAILLDLTSGKKRNRRLKKKQSAD
jgi:hypothetical protein